MDNDDSIVALSPHVRWDIDVDSFIEELDFCLLIDDVESLSMTEVAAQLAGLGLADRADASVYGEGAVALAARAESGNLPPKVRRERVLAQLADHMATNDIVVVAGARGCGKTQVVHDFLELMDEEGRATQFLDLFSLRMASRGLLSRAALGLMMPGVAEALDMKGADDPDFSRAFHDGLLARLNKGATLVFDNIDRIIDRPEPLQWLLDIVALVRSREARAILVCRGARCGIRSQRKARGATRDLATGLKKAADATLFHIDDFSPTELVSWLDDPWFSDHRSSGLDASSLAACVGGRPRLIKDFGTWLGTSDKRGSAALTAFQDQAARTYCAECDRLIEALRQFPEWLTDPLAAPRHVWSFLIETGGMIEKDDRLVFSAPLIADRFAYLTGTKGMARLIGRSLDTVLSSRAFPELAVAPLCAYCQIKSPKESLAAVVRVLETIGVTDVVLSVADRGNSKLWSKVYPIDSSEREAKPLNEDDRPDFAVALKTGRPRVTPRDRLFLPVFGETGRVEVVAEGQLPEIADPLRRCARLRRLTGFAELIQPVLAVAVERLAHKRYMKLQRSRYYRALNSGEAHDVRGNLLLTAVQMMNCSAVAILERGLSSWVVSTLQEASGPSGATPWEELLSGSVENALNAIADHPSRRGLVLSGRELLVAFPRLRNIPDDVAVFMHPVWNRALCRLIVFVFKGAASREIDGLKQMELSNTALYAAI